MTTRDRSAKPAGQGTWRRERLPAQLSQVNLDAAGIDVGASRHFVAVPQDRRDQTVRGFEAFTADLYRPADWISNGHCALRNGKPINRATNWCLCPMLRAIFRACPSTRRRSFEKQF